MIDLSSYRPVAQEWAASAFHVQITMPSFNRNRGDVDYFTSHAAQPTQTATTPEKTTGTGKKYIQERTSDAI
ncbi:MAG: hypothetical protein QOC81_4059 [Thermoanaerobaculia bacterium]|nr:hypothetical protein [Thermoanaerobaculia bacterium]